MKQSFNHKFLPLLFAVICSITVLFSGCNFPSGPNSPQKTQTVTPAANADKTSADYLVIPLTAGNVSPISACSYDLLHTVCTIQLYDSTDYSILNECFAIIDKYEKLFSRTQEDSELYSINKASSDGETIFTVSNELKDILDFSLKYADLSDGALDISIALLSSLWDFSNLEHKTEAPSADSIAKAQALVNYRDITLEGNTLSFAKEGMQLELGAVAKGYIADRVKEFLLSKGVTSAIINLGGNILLVGEKPEGTAFNVGIQKPFEDRDSIVVAISELKDCSMVSSGIYERYFYDANGSFYHHILDASTGYPCNTDLTQVTIISKDSATGDALSTACFALGLEKGMELIHSLEDIYAVFITSDGELHFSDGFLENIPTRTE